MLREPWYFSAMPAPVATGTLAAIAEIIATIRFDRSPMCMLASRPRVNPPTRPIYWANTRFGSIPDYAFSGPGMRLDGTSPGGPAEKAGLLRGDVLVGIGDTTIEGIGDFMFVLNTHKPGDVLTVRFLRDGTEERAQVTLESNQVE